MAPLAPVAIVAPVVPRAGGRAVCGWRRAPVSAVAPVTDAWVLRRSAATPDNLIVGAVDQDLRKCCQRSYSHFSDCSGRPPPAKATWPPPSGSRSSRTDGACCACAPAISCNVCRRRELALESALAKLDKYHLLILDDIVYVPQQRQRVMGGDPAKKAQVTGAIPRCDTATEWAWA